MRYTYQRNLRLEISRGRIASIAWHGPLVHATGAASRCPEANLASSLHVNFVRQMDLSPSVDVQLRLEASALIDIEEVLDINQAICFLFVAILPRS